MFLLFDVNGGWFFLFLLYTDFSYFSTAFLMFTPCLIMSFQVFRIDLRFSSLLIMFLYDWSCPPCLILSFIVFLLSSPVILPVLTGWYCLPPIILRGILMRIATILWSVWSNDCLRLPVKLTLFLSYLFCLSGFSSVLFLSLFTAMMILFSSVSLMLIRNNVFGEVSSVYYLCPLDLKMLSRDVFVFINLSMPL